MKVDKSMMEKLYQNRVFAIIQWVLSKFNHEYLTKINGWKFVLYCEIYMFNRKMTTKFRFRPRNSRIESIKIVKNWRNIY